MRAGTLISAVLLSVGLASVAQAKPEFLDTLTATYPQSATALNTRACSNCHVSDADTTLNPYGKQLQDKIKAAGGNKLTADILHQVEALDADGDGASNIDEIKAGTAPGDPKSVPAGAHPAAAPAAPAGTKPAAPAAPAHPAAAPATHPAASGSGHTPPPDPASGKPAAPTSTAPAAAPTTTAATATSTSPTANTLPTTAAPGAAAGAVAAVAGTAPAAATSSAAAPGTPGAESSAPAIAVPASSPEPPWWSPKNAWHPAIVHFPIALFLGGLLFDLAGAFKKNKALLLGGWYNLVLAAITAVVAVMSGVWAMVNLKLGMASATGVLGMSTIGLHMALALVSTLIMWVMVSLRVHRHEQMNSWGRLLYYVLAFIALVAISYAGHLGGEYVYGS